MNQNAIIAGIVLLIILASPKRGGADAPIGADIFKVSFLGNTGPRGIRNNNPGNIKINDSNNWKGKVPRPGNTDGVFEQFYFYVDGVRAMIVLVRNYINQGFDTISKIVNRYAPGGTHENNPTGAYVGFVSGKVGIIPSQKVSVSFETLAKVISAMAEFENGEPAITQEMFAAAWSIV